MICHLGIAFRNTIKMSQLRYQDVDTEVVPVESGFIHPPRITLVLCPWVIMFISFAGPVKNSYSISVYIALQGACEWSPQGLKEL